ncbi:MAG: PSD1 domain-containing protein [Saprospiraceae bacterium]|nr:PSD1 domain-containing protein [Saprospiraceae bacterium]
MRLLFIVISVFTCIGCQSDDYKADLPEVVDFNQHIRPILSNNCYVCHGPDVSSRKADLRLDTEEYAKSRGKSGSIPIKAGSTRKSEVYRRITEEDPEMIMPPPKTNRTLTEYEVALIGRWIEQGAHWKKHWALIAPEDGRLANSNDHLIDSWTAQYLVKAGLQHNTQASAPALVRRLSYLITGLPPRLKDLEIAVNDSSAYETYVDSLLASPHYGERWARHWMDLVRYAEGRGHEFDYPVIGAWQYRDYLIRAFNADLPYDDFIREQLAGDLLESPRINAETKLNESTIGTLFLNLGEGKHSPVDTKDEEKIRIDNMIDVTTKTFLAQTVACARCHDHKFDDIPTTDYYALYGIFESTRAHLYPAEATVDYPAHVDSIVKLKEELKRYLTEITGPVHSPAATFISNSTVDSTSVDFKFIGDFRGEDFGNWTSDGYCFGEGTTLGEVVTKSPLNQAKIAASGVASSQKFTRGLSGALRSPTFIIDKDYLLFRAAGQHSSIRIIMDNLQLVQAPIHGDFTRILDDGAMRDYLSYVGQWKGNKAYIEIFPGTYYSKKGKGHHYKLDPEAWIELAYVMAMDSLVDFASDNLLTDSNDYAPWQVIPNSIFTDYTNRLNQYSSKLQDTLFYAGMTEGDNIESPVFIRGDHRNLSEEKVPHRFLSALPIQNIAFPDTGSGRLALAEAIASPDNPLTARVIVNRIWHHLFGRGLVSTVDNFGLQGSLPSHPELLDHLALWFTQNNWSVKKLIKYIVTSETFKQSTDHQPAAFEIDPENKLLHGYPLRRLEAEAIRDGILACSGRLDLTMYGRSVPMYLTEFLQGRGRPAESGPLDGKGRRSIYQAIWRNFLPPFMTTFDMPIPFSTFGDRSETNVPAQSLTLLNDPFVKEQAQVWAKALVDERGSPEKKIRKVYLQAFSRQPTEAEIKEALDFLKDQEIKYSAEQNIELLIWSDYCHSIFNMKEFIYLL